MNYRRSGRGFVAAAALLPLVLIIWYSPFSKAYGENRLTHYQGIVHVHSDYSTGVLSIPMLVKQARDRGIRIIFITDHDLIKFSYGAPLFPFLFKTTKSLPSVISNGPESYLKKIEEARLMFPDMVLIPGVESAPFYYWEGSPLKKNLKVVNWRKHLLILGSEDPEFYSGLPVAHNMKRSFHWNDRDNLRTLYIFIVPLIIGILMLWWEKPFRIAGVVIMAFSIMAAGNFILSGEAIYSPFKGDAGVAPYQRVIDYADEHDALVFWAHPESNLEISEIETPIGTISFETPPHPEDLLLTRNYTGFEAMYKDVRHFIDPGEEWDQVLLQHIEGERQSPAWGIAGLDFHGDRGKDERMDDVITVFMLPDLNKQAVLDAMRMGRVYSLWRTPEYRLIMETFQVKGMGGGGSGISGDRVSVKGAPEVFIKIVADDGSSRKLNISLVRNGEQVAAFEGTTPFEGSFVDSLEKPERVLYYRIDVKGPRPHRITSNPIFVEVGSDSS